VDARRAACPLCGWRPWAIWRRRLSAALLVAGVISAVAGGAIWGIVWERVGRLEWRITEQQKLLDGWSRAQISAAVGRCPAPAHPAAGSSR